MCDTCDLMNKITGEFDAMWRESGHSLMGTLSYQPHITPKTPWRIGVENYDCEEDMIEEDWSCLTNFFGKTLQEAYDNFLMCPEYKEYYGGYEQLSLLDNEEADTQSC